MEHVTPLTEGVILTEKPIEITCFINTLRQNYLYGRQTVYFKLILSQNLNYLSS